MSELQLFNFKSFPIRTVEVNGAVLFVAKDVATALGYADAAQAVKDHCKKAVNYTNAIKRSLMKSKSCTVQKLWLSQNPMFTAWSCVQNLNAQRNFKIGSVKRFYPASAKPAVTAFLSF
jgi:prophage antirepressor-like protein